MTDLTHTPGPWTLHPSDRAGRPDKITDSRGARVATINAPMLPDAALIAQAPAGLALARHIVAMADDAYLGGHPEFDAILAEARALIAAVKAQS